MNIPKRIAEAIEQKRLVIFAGSGLSSSLNLPSWKKLVIDVIDLIDDTNLKQFKPVLESDLMTPIEVLEKLRKENNQIRGYIKNNFRVEKADLKLHKKLIELSGQIITTNYDDAFEKASEYRIDVTTPSSKFNLSELNKIDKNYLFKIHGTYNEPDNCVLFKDQYNELYNSDNGNGAKEKLKSIFAERVILFIGFSFNDLDIVQIFTSLDKTFGNNNIHFILTTEPGKFKQFSFLEEIPIADYSLIDQFVDECLLVKSASKNNQSLQALSDNTSINRVRIAFLKPEGIDRETNDDINKVLDAFDTLDVDLVVGYLNRRTLLLIEDFDLVVIATRVFKTKIFIEDDNLKTISVSVDEVVENIPNDNIPIVFITNEVITLPENRKCANVSSFKNSVVKRFVYKTFKERKLVSDENIQYNFENFLSGKILNGTATRIPIYGRQKNLPMGRKCLTGVVGRVEEQALIATKLLECRKTNRLLNIKASGGVGKTTLVKKISYDLYNRGYYRAGVTFNSCENVRSISDFEELIIAGFELTNILDFRSYLEENFSSNKLDLLVILDNFETVVNHLDGQHLSEAIDLLKFVTDYGNVVITSREKVGLDEDFEEVLTLSRLTTDDALSLFRKHYTGNIQDSELRMLRNDILEDLLDNNPLAIKLVMKANTSFSGISELKSRLEDQFFQSTDIDYTDVYTTNADLNIERSKSIFQCVNYSYAVLNEKEKLAFQILSLFPDGISLHNFKNCFSDRVTAKRITDKDLRSLRDKSLVEDYNGVLQLQPIIRRFAEYQFGRIDEEERRKDCLEAYLFNCYVLDLIELIDKKSSIHQAIKLFSRFKHNLLNVLAYIPQVLISEDGKVTKKSQLLNYVYSASFFIVGDKATADFQTKINALKPFFEDLKNAEQLIKVLELERSYYQKEFDISYSQLSHILPADQMLTRVIKEEDDIETMYKDLICHIHSMEGWSLDKIKIYMINAAGFPFMGADFFYLGIVDNIVDNNDGFYLFEYALMHDRLNIPLLEKFIADLFQEDHLEIMQCTYVLSKVKNLEHKTISRLVVTNPYTAGLKYLMFAFIEDNLETKIALFENALKKLEHIRYYYLEALYYYAVFIKDHDRSKFDQMIKHGLESSQRYHYQYLKHKFDNAMRETQEPYTFTYSFYNTEGLEKFVQKHNTSWEKRFKEIENEEL